MARASKTKDQDGRYVQALSAMKEDDLSLRILKPLFEAMGWERVEFYGGSHERGIDLIAQRKLPPRTTNYVLVVQTKKTSGLSVAETSRLVHQLRQACTAAVNSEPGSHVVPDEVYLACPERITTRLLDELASQLAFPYPRIHIYDGPQIVSHIKLHKPELLNELGSIHDRLVSLEDSNLRNQELLDALSSQSVAETKNFYSDLSFFVGSIDSNVLLHLEPKPGAESIFVAESAWPGVRLQIERMQEKYGVRLSTRAPLEVEETFDQEMRAFKAVRNQRNLSSLRAALAGAEELRIEVGKRTRDVESQYVSSTAKPDPRLPEILDFIGAVRLRLQAKPTSTETFKAPPELNPLPESLQPLLDKSIEISGLNEKIAKLENAVLWEPTYRVDYAYSSVAKAIGSRIETYLQSVARIESRRMSAPELKSFLRDTLSTLGLVAQLERDPTELRKCIEFGRKATEQDRISISPHDVFDSRENIAVYGGAGVGKTTTLQAYVERSFLAGRRDIIYVPLNRIVDKLFRIGQSFQTPAKQVVAPTVVRRAIRASSDSALANWLSDRLLAKVILISRGLSHDETDVAEAQALLNKGVTLILDGLDEAFDTVPQLIEAIIELNATNRETQLIVSSRDCVSYLRNIDFLGITLLPFTPDQLNRFIRGWLVDGQKAEQLVRAVEERELYEHMRTPLLATIACVLMEKGIEVRTNEREIYAEHNRLLTGGYDSHKHINRQSQTSELLQRVARRVAYEMHRKRVRSLPLDALTEIAADAFADSHSPALIRECIGELINPCNVLVLDRSISEYSFGHFRFQEHLAAEELGSLGRSALVDRLSIDWWRGALCLYAQNADFHELFEEAYKTYGNIRGAERTLQEMIANAPARKRAGLEELFVKYIDSDEADEILLMLDYPPEEDEVFVQGRDHLSSLW